ncbi:hypothetical protein SAMN06295885_3156 [Rathayibacter oskolensis]|uniref:Uncharacterized protein n=1 Tax=Rathayibacter oskolensis TaxID=1891671 RepID=A0A1X7PEN3_9MICO|nr:hypothetical protein [Rathayibacter oskolensis]SMH48890.1 hypothetical protein SAMN06295885_3156 [Rathayibacter oskolensis]
MSVRSRALVAVLLTGAVAASLAGCVPGADPTADPTTAGSAAPAATASTTPTATDPAAATPTASATPAVADAAALLMGPTSFTLVDDSGVELGTWEYRNGTGAVAALTEAFGSAPTESDDIPYEGYSSRKSSWPGFAYRDYEVYDAGGPESTYPEPDFQLEATAPVVGDVAISTLGGVSVGDTTAEVQAEHPEGLVDSGAGVSLAYFRFDETVIGTQNGGDLTNSVGVLAEDEIAVSSIRAPFVNWGV